MKKKNQENKLVFKKVKSYKKRVKCCICGKLIIISNYNQKKCEDCGYKDKHKYDKDDKE